MADEKDQIMTRVNISDEEWEVFRKMVAPMSAADAVGKMILFSIEAENAPFSKVVENLLKDLMTPKKKGSPS